MSDAQKFFQEGMFNLAAQDFTQAIENFTRAIELAPDFGDAYGSRGMVYGIIGDTEKALADFDRAKPRNGNDVVARRVFVDGAFFTHLRRRFVRRLAETNANADGFADAVFARFQVARLDAERTVDFGAEVEENRAALREDAALRFVPHNRGRRLSKYRLQKEFRVFNAGFGRPNDALREEILTDALVVNGAGRQVGGEAFRERNRFSRVDRLREDGRNASARRDKNRGKASQHAGTFHKTSFVVEN